MTTQDFIIALFCAVDQEMLDVPKHPGAKLYPSEVVTLALLFAIKGGGTRAFYRWLTRDYQALFPQVPSVVESGYAYVTSWIWYGLFLPGGASAQLVERIHRDTTAILKRPEFVAKYLTESSLDAVANSPAEFTEAIRADVASFSEMVKAADVQPE